MSSIGITKDAHDILHEDEDRYEKNRIQCTNFRGFKKRETKKRKGTESFDEPRTKTFVLELRSNSSFTFITRCRGEEKGKKRRRKRRTNTK